MYTPGGKPFIQDTVLNETSSLRVIIILNLYLSIYNLISTQPIENKQ